MAVAVFMARSAYNPNPAKDKMCHKVGDFINAYPDGKRLGKNVGPPLFTRIHFPGIKAEVLRERYRGPVLEETGDPENPYRPIKRHRWTLLRDELSADLRAKIFPAVAGPKHETIQAKVRPMAGMTTDHDVTWESLRQHLYDHAQKKRETRAFSESDRQRIITER